MTYNSPFPAPITKGSDDKMKAMSKASKGLPTPIANASMPVKYGTTPQQDKMRQALRLLGAGQQFPNQPPQLEG